MCSLAIHDVGQDTTSGAGDARGLLDDAWDECEEKTTTSREQIEDYLRARQVKPSQAEMHV